MTSRMQIKSDYIALFVEDVQQNPAAYKASVVADPRGAAATVLDGLTRDECAQMLRDLREEIRTVKRATQ